MKAIRPKAGRGVWYHRDSSGKHDQSLPSYVEAAAREAKRLGVKFRGTAKEIKRMVESKQCVSGDLFLDYGIAGNLMSRPALDALKQQIRDDPTISHLFVAHRDRFARPDDPVEGMELEKEFRKLGVSIVFNDQILAPLLAGQRQGLGEQITALVDYHNSGQFREHHAEKMIYAQIELAKHGYSTGGRAAFGFDRHLVKTDGTIVRRLNDRESVRQPDHHVIHLPKPDKDFALVLRILSMLKTLRASHVCRILEEEGIPSPDAGRSRTDNGITHEVSGLWNPSTINNIARNPLLRGMVQFGRRGMGDQRRMTPEGPRPLEDDDYRSVGKDESSAKKTPKVKRNSDAETVTGPAHFPTIVPKEDLDELIKILDERGSTQRGKPRSRNPDLNPLGARIFDMDCGWPMYRVPRGKGFHYTCGWYQQSHGQQCNHNHSDGPTAARYALATVRQLLFAPVMRKLLEEKLRERFSAAPKANPAPADLNDKRAKLKTLQAEMTKAMRNMVTAEPEFEKDYKNVVRTLKAEEAKLAQELSQAEAIIRPSKRQDDLVAEAMKLFDKLPALANDSNDPASLRKLFDSINLEMFLGFKKVQKTKRIVNQVSGGILKWGNAPSPIEKYSGPTDRQNVKGAVGKKQKSSASKLPTEPCSPPDSDRSAKSSGNVNRADRI